MVIGQEIVADTDVIMHEGNKYLSIPSVGEYPVEIMPVK